MIQMTGKALSLCMYVESWFLIILVSSQVGNYENMHLAEASCGTAGFWRRIHFLAAQRQRRIPGGEGQSENLLDFFIVQP